MSDARWIVGVDVGGTNVAVGAVPADGGEPVGLRSRPTARDGGGDAVVTQIAEMVGETLAELEAEAGAGRSAVAGVGIGSPGPLDRRTGVVLETPNLGWTDFPIRDRVSKAVSLPAVLDNDANCATYGEWWLGAGRGARSVVGLTLGTGIGGGVVLDGRIHHGASDVAGEIGHMTVDYRGRRCSCGSVGCLEAYASGPNIAARAVEALEDGEESIIPELVEGDLASVTAETVHRAVTRGDAFAVRLLTDTARILGAGVASLLNVLNPEVVVLAGGVAGAGEDLFGPLRAEAERRAFRPAVEACRIVPAELPGTSGVLGAAGVFRSERMDPGSDGGSR